MIFFIPARLGSERIVHKNVRLVAGSPLISWTFDALTKLHHNLCREVFVSTDDPMVEDLAEQYHYHVLPRPAGLAQATTTMSDVLFHHLPDFKLAHATEVCILYPTSPLRNEMHIVEAASLWSERGYDDLSLMSVTPVYHRPYGLLRVGNDGFTHYVSNQGDKYYQAQNQPPLYRANGAIYIIPIPLLETRKINTQLFSPKTLPFVMDEVSSFEVDTEHDLVIAESYLKTKKLDAPVLALHVNGDTQ